MQTTSTESDKQQLELLRAAVVRRPPKAPSAARRDAGQKGAPLGKSAKPRRASSADNAPAAEKRCQPSSGSTGNLHSETDCIQLSAKKISGAEKISSSGKKFPKKGCGNGLGDEQRQQDCRRVNAEVQGCGSESDLMEVSRVGGDCGAARFAPDARSKPDIGRGEFDFIRITGANQHNLKNISLEIPRGLMVAFTGRSGSGKSSLAFDTIYAEGYRKYMESLSADARRLMSQIDKPAVESITGLSPVIAIEQVKSLGSNPRSTLATLTEIADYARLVWSLSGDQFCPKDGGKIERRSLDECVDAVMDLPAGSRVYLLAPRYFGRLAGAKDAVKSIRLSAWQRARIAGKIVELDDPAAEKEAEGTTGSPSATATAVTYTGTSGKLTIASVTFTITGLTGVESKTLDQKQLEDLNSAIYITKYTNAESYYTVLIKHFGDDLTPWNEANKTDNPYPDNDSSADNNWLGRYGVLRNNWYEIEVTGIKGIGSATVPDVNDDPTPDDNVEKYISVKINMLSWAKRKQSVTLE